ncbi:MAG: hypothetical protein JXC85_00860 [Candidatus Aenigmarchaeota archaeon]|nr:hypothetical protein [Candidatus Aenigmarchaeota archaeon]
MKYRKKAKQVRRKRRVSIDSLLHGGSSFDFFKYGSAFEDLLDQDDLEDIGSDDKGKKDETDDESPEGESESNNFYKHSLYSRHDLYKDDKEQYALNAMDILRDTTHFTSEGRRSNISAHTQDPHLRRLVLKEKML